jgi:hypothetical protein
MTDLAPVRVGDRERGETDARLRDALADGVLTLSEYDERAGLCWGARTRSELDALLADLPTTAAAPGVPPGPAPSARRVRAVLSESSLESPVLPGQPLIASAVMGTADVDLRREDLPAEVQVRATAVMGEVRVHVPPGTSVVLTGGGVLGERKARLGPPMRGGSVVHVHATAVLGTVKVDDKPRKQGLLPAVRDHLLHHPPPAPRAGSVAVAPVHRSSSPLSRVVGKVLPVALVGAALFGAGQVVTAEQRALFGSSEQRVQLDDVDGSYDVGVAFGSVTVVVPDEVRARVTGTMVFGSSDCDEACSGDQEQVLEVNGTGAFGSIEVITESEQRKRDASSEQEERLEELEDAREDRD